MIKYMGIITITLILLNSSIVLAANKEVSGPSFIVLSKKDKENKKGVFTDNKTITCNKGRNKMIIRIIYLSENSNKKKSKINAKCLPSLNKAHSVKAEVSVPKPPKSFFNALKTLIKNKASKDKKPDDSEYIKKIATCNFPIKQMAFIIDSEGKNIITYCDNNRNGDGTTGLSGSESGLNNANNGTNQAENQLPPQYRQTAEQAAAEGGAYQQPPSQYQQPPSLYQPPQNSSYGPIDYNDNYFGDYKEASDYPEVDQLQEEFGGVDAESENFDDLYNLDDLSNNEVEWLAEAQYGAVSKDGDTVSEIDDVSTELDEFSNTGDYATMLDGLDSDDEIDRLLDGGSSDVIVGGVLRERVDTDIDIAKYGEQFIDLTTEEWFDIEYMSDDQFREIYGPMTDYEINDIRKLALDINQRSLVFDGGFYEEEQEQQYAWYNPYRWWVSIVSLLEDTNPVSGKYDM